MHTEGMNHYVFIAFESCVQRYAVEGTPERDANAKIAAETLLRTRHAAQEPARADQHPALGPVTAPAAIRDDLECLP